MIKIYQFLLHLLIKIDKFLSLILFKFIFIINKYIKWIIKLNKK